MSDETITIDQVGDPDRFQISVDGAPAGFTQFVDSGEDRIFFHTVMDPAFGGRGLGGKLVSAALDRTREAGRPVVAICPFVAGYIDKHPDYADDTVTPTEAHIATARAHTQL